MKTSKYLTHWFIVVICALVLIQGKYSKPDRSQTNQKSKNSLLKRRASPTTTIAGYRMSSNTPVTYYLPYLVKMGLLVFPETQINYDDLTTVCDDSKCHFCNMLYPNLCYRCATGYYLTGKNCEPSCPSGYIADVLRGKCFREEEIETSTVLSKVYTVGSCANQCGNPKVGDCSCSKTCKQNVNCCYDYMTVNCDRLFDMSKSVEEQCKSVTDCDLCDRTEKVGESLKCNQCVNGKYLHDGQCYNQCPQDTQPDKNNVCNRITTCSVDNCTECLDGLITKCKTCERGYYLFNGNCLSICPMGYRADRISWNCLEYPVFSWYYIFPSKGTCKGNCQQEGSIHGCACDGSCVRRGDCCQDFEEFCLDFAVLRKEGNS